MQVVDMCMYHLTVIVTRGGWRTLNGAGVS